MAYIGGIFVPSKDSVVQSARLKNQSEEDIAKEYMGYPVLPVNQKVKVDKLAILNFDCITKEKLGKLTYGTFRRLYPEVYFKCRDPNLDYEDSDQVAPAIIISGDIKYRVDQVLWYPLSDVINGILKKQGRTGRKVLPIEVFVDERNQWMVPLFNSLIG